MTFIQFVLIILINIIPFFWGYFYEDFTEGKGFWFKFFSGYIVAEITIVLIRVLILIA